MANPRVLLVCEGEEDKRFFEALIATHNLHHIGFCIWPSRGNTKFADAISAFEVERPGVFRQLKAVLLVADKNDSAALRFNQANAEIAKLDGRKPNAAEMQPSSGIPPIYALMMPTDDDAGHLEAQCYHAAERADAASARHVEAFLAMAGADKWPSKSRWFKAWLRANLAIRCSDPGETLARVFSENKHSGLIPMDDGAFKKLVDALKTFAPS